MKIRKGDSVIVISGKDKGVSGKVLEAFPKSETVIVEGANISQRHQKPRKQGQQGQIVDKAMPIHVSNIMVKDPKDNKPTRVGYKEVKGKKVRVTKRSGTELSS